MRKLLSILLLGIFFLPSAAPLFALGHQDESALPACCRRGGAHHCMAMQMHGQTSGNSPQWSAATDRCPYCPASVVTSHVEQVAMIAAQSIFAGVVSHPAVHAQTESMWRISRDRTRQKRGPPSAV